MMILRSIQELRAWRRTCRQEHATVAFVPTMGYLHEGHLTLCREGKSRAQKVITSIFVNPLQFGPTEDLSRYPRDEAGDIRRLESVGVDAVFLPSVEEMYPKDFFTSVEVVQLTDGLCGRSRPGHFKGVTTVVAKLFHLVQPDVALFGLKDYQQFQVIRRMAIDLCMDLEVVGIPTVREPDGLAMSSRNAYLTPEGRAAATVLSRTLFAVREAWHEGERRAEALQSLAVGLLQSEPLAVIDYVDVVDAETLGPLLPGRAAVIAMAVRIQNTRLIDNLVLV